MNIDLVFPVLPPTLDGIGDHTARLAAALSPTDQVRVLCAQPDHTPLPGVEVIPAFDLHTRRGIQNLQEAVREHPPDWLLVQFNQFSYGRWGLNPFLPLTLYQIKRACPSTRIAWLAHEDFMPATTLKFALMSTWQRAQFWALGHLADHIFFTTDYWVEAYKSWFPNTPMQRLAVGSNIPNVNTSRDAERARLGIAPDAFVVGYFGSLHNSRLLPTLRTALRQLRRLNDQVLVLYVGPEGNGLQEILGAVPVHNAGVLPAGDVSRCFAAMDLHLTPILDGVSTRRGSFMTGLQHGVPTVTTSGPHTAPWMQAAHDDAFLLAPEDAPDQFARHARALMTNDTHRRRIGTGGQAFYRQHFDWPVLATQLRRALDAETPSPTAARTSEPARTLSSPHT
jgi:glycosyltransferase involved in cell wall biosynthesis